MLDRHECSQFFITCKSMNNTNDATHYVKLGKKRRESSKRNYYIISPRVIIKSIIINRTDYSVITTIQFVKNSNKESGKLKTLCIWQTLSLIKPREIQIAHHQFNSKTVYTKHLTSSHVIQTSQLLDLCLHRKDTLVQERFSDFQNHWSDFESKKSLRWFSKLVYVSKDCSPFPHRFFAPPPELLAQ